MTSDNAYACVSCEYKYGTYRSFWDPNSRECVRKCPDETPAIGALNICQTCKQTNETLPFWNPVTRECV